MNDLLIKYQSLTPDVQREVDDFLEFVLAKYKGKKVFDMKAWKKKVKKVSVWSEKDIQVFKETDKLFSQWRAKNW